MVLVGKEFACIKISGRANFNLSVEFKTLITELQRKGYAFFVLELSECVLMDSTFLGVLAGLVLKPHQPAGDLPGPTLQLRNANARIMDLFENLGVLHLFKIAEGPVTAAESLETCAPSAEPASRVEITRACLEAHQTLMEVNPDNVARFKDVTKFLAEDLAKLQRQS